MYFKYVKSINSLYNQFTSCENEINQKFVGRIPWSPSAGQPLFLDM